MQTQVTADQVIFNYLCSETMKQAVLEVLTKLPANDLDLLQRRRITIFEKDLSADQIFGGVEYDPGDTWSLPQNTVYLDFRELPTSELRRAVIAHELGHVFHNHGKDRLRWWESKTMTHGQRVEARNRIEHEADSQVLKWGFRQELVARDQWKFSLMAAEAQRIEARRK